MPPGRFPFPAASGWCGLVLHVRNEETFQITIFNVNGDVHHSPPLLGVLHVDLGYAFGRFVSPPKRRYVYKHRLAQVTARRCSLVLAFAGEALRRREKYAEGECQGDGK